MFKIVIIDDEPQLRSLIRSLLPPGLGIHIVGEAADGLEGFKLCCKLKPDLVITDIRMPEMDGLTLLEKISQALPSTQVIVVSGYGEFAYAQKAILHGAVGYLLKPVEEREFYQALEKAVTAITARQDEKRRFDQMKQALVKLQSSLTAQESPRSNSLVQSNSPVIQKVLQSIYDNYNRDISLEEIAAKMYMNSAYLSRLFKEKVGVGFQDFLTDVRISHAKTLLDRPEFKVGEVAELSGYRDVSHFIGVFKKHTGMTPSEYAAHRNK